jgi:ADP-heptose:LPS heptosyltransferase
VGQNFLIVQLRQIGDVVLTTPIARILKEELPGSRVSFLTEAPCDQLLRGNPFLDEILMSDRSGGWVETLRLGRRLRKRRFDAVLDFMGNPRSAILSRLAGAPMRVTYPVKGRGVLYTHRVRPPDGYAVDYKKGLLQPLGVRSKWNCPEIFLTDDELESGRAVRQELLAGGSKRLITVDPSHRRRTRRWPASHFGALCRRIRDELDALPLVLWGPGEERIAEEVIAASEARAVKARSTALRQMAAIIAAADLHLGNCSAPRHVAVAVGVPSFTILGSTSPAWTHPAAHHAELALGAECQPCNRNDCPREFACLRDLAPAQVFGELSAWTRQTLGWR